MQNKPQNVYLDKSSGHARMLRDRGYNTHDMSSDSKDIVSTFTLGNSSNVIHDTSDYNLNLNCQPSTCGLIVLANSVADQSKVKTGD